MTNEALIAHAAQHLHPYTTPQGRLFGDVAATLVTDQGTIFSGVCIDTGSSTGFCAEHAAIAAMVTAGEYRIARIVAVWRNEHKQQLFVLPPCGRCREFMRQIDEAKPRHRGGPGQRHGQAAQGTAALPCLARTARSLVTSCWARR